MASAYLRISTPLSLACCNSQHEDHKISKTSACRLSQVSTTGTHWFDNQQQESHGHFQLSPTIVLSGSYCLCLMDLLFIFSQFSIGSLQIQLLKQEKERLEKTLDEMHRQHKVELEKQQIQHFQTFRNYREMFDKQKLAIEKRYRNLLDDAIQDAIFLSSRNSELVEENEQLKSGNKVTDVPPTILSSLDVTCVYKCFFCDMIDPVYTCFAK